MTTQAGRPARQRRTDDVDVVVVGAGPNGLAAAVVCARAGLSVEVVEAADTIGGGARTQELTLPGFRHDVCSAVHPMAVASPFFEAFDLAAHGVDMLQPEIPYAQPLDGGRAGLAFRDLERTVEGLGVDGPAWRSLVGRLAETWRGTADVALSDFRSLPRHPLQAASFAAAVFEQGTRAWDLRFREDVAPALLTGVSSHAIAPPRRLAPAAGGLWLASLAHARGWPIPRGGSQSMMDALADDVRARGGVIRTGEKVESLGQLPRARAVMMDVAPQGLLDVAGDQLPPGYRRWLERWRYGGGVCKVDYALSGPVPWAAEHVDRAGTVHLAGSRPEMQAAERDVVAGRHAERPVVLACQPGVVDDSRAPEGKHTLWTYAHVPNNSPRDISDQITAQIERFAPGFRDLVLATDVLPAAGQQGREPNNVGGDIATGAVTPWQLVMRPVPTWDPYRTPLNGVYLASASVPPGPAVHGMGGVHAAGRVLRQRFGRKVDPLDVVRDAA
ncbi:NAD(P)/FAD-dependent oxidoreductase [uncultured Pseudokineococcus sp.]|uniref:phytoene desaturase family protein n=1 Tax=uncultured Pseudokineococcus sp. TaxID=1642928 RepID=UPI0026311E44|nr:NAD(P)/FAD-dependent oxidoreductase [uncultured Pseudokineococcus sp.]